VECHKVGYKHINFTTLTDDRERYLHIHEKYHDRRRAVSLKVREYEFVFC
jgi:hypothetical protein